MVKRAGGPVVVGLFIAGLLHVVWVFSPWPLATRADFARTVVGVDEAGLPSAPLTVAVAAALALAAYLVAARARLVPAIGPAWMIRLGVWTVAVVLLLRGIGGVIASGFGLMDAPSDYTFWDLRLYSPLCLLLGGLSAWVAVLAARGGVRPSR